jgi:GxxExxY protein
MVLVTTPSASTIIQCAIDVHKALGPGLFESAYQPMLSAEMKRAGLRFEEQVTLPVSRGGIVVTKAYRADFIVEDEVLVEIKSVSKLLPLHQSQVLTYLKLSGLRKGLLINFNVPLLKYGLRSVVN